MSVRIEIIPSMKIRRSVKCRTHRSRLSCSIRDTIHCARVLIVVTMIHLDRVVIKMVDDGDYTHEAANTERDLGQMFFSLLIKENR